MQEYDSVQYEIEQLLFELARCVNDLRRLHRQLSLTDRKEAALSKSKLDALLCNTIHSNVSRLSAIV